jgi:hypothetical protein
LRVAVVNEPGLAEAINRLRGEWTERSGGELTANEVTWADLSGAKTVDADVVIFPSRYLGELCVRDWLRPVRPHVLESSAFDAPDIFPLVRQQLVSWGGQVMALPLGANVPMDDNGEDHQPAISLLSRAAPGAVSKKRIGVLFDSETMKPRIAEPPFVAALAELAQTNGEQNSSPADDNSIVPVLGYADRLAGVTTSTHNAASAFKLLEWISQAETSSQLARAGNGTMPVRRSLVTSRSWFDAGITASQRAKIGKALEAVLNSDQYLIIPRIPGIDEYMTALDEAVQAAALKGDPPPAALENTAKRWDEITDSRGRDVQRAAYLKHLGISDD